MYSKENARLILKKFHDKHWNVYKKSGNPSRNDLIKSGRVNQLEQDSEYYLFPFVPDVTNVSQVSKAEMKVGDKLGNQLPFVKLNNENYYLGGFLLRESFITILPNLDNLTDHRTYQEFINVIDSYVSCKDLT